MESRRTPRGVDVDRHGERRPAERWGEDQIEGRHPVLEALRAGRPLRKLVVARATTGGSLPAILAEARRRGVPIQEVDPSVIKRLAQSRAPQGVIAYAAIHQTVDLVDVLQAARARREAPFLLLLDGVEDPGNLGAILRSAEAAGVHGVVIPRRRAAGLSPAVAASSAGAVENVLVAQVANIAQAIERLKTEGIWCIGADAGAAKSIYETPLKPPIAVIVGGEGRGLSRLVRDRCDLVMRIPMHGTTASLNVSVAAALVLFEVRRQMHATLP